MDLPLPLDQFRFNLVLWILVTAYWASGIWNFMAFIPWWSKEDYEMLWYTNKSNYSFWLISSLLFFLLWISQFSYTCFIYLSIAEIYVVIIAYLYLVANKRRYSKNNKEKIKELEKKRIENLKWKWI